MPQGGILQNGRLSLRLAHFEACLSAKESVDKHCFAHEKKIVVDMIEMLEKCALMGAGNNLTTPPYTADMEDTWCDFQQA